MKDERNVAHMKRDTWNRTKWKHMSCCKTESYEYSFEWSMMDPEQLRFGLDCKYEYCSKFIFNSTIITYK